jgi:hypothetical protein
MRIIAFIIDHDVVDAILRHLAKAEAQLRIRRRLPIREADRRVGTRSGAPERA